VRALIAGGGTGGHVIPAIAIARELQAQFGAEVLFVGTPRGIENRLVPAAGFPLKLVRVGALKNVSLVTRFRTAFDLPRAVIAASGMISDFKPTVVIGVGGYASGPAMLAAVARRIPTMAFEPNFVPGFANKAVAKFVSAACVHFDETARYFRNAHVTGVPIRREFTQLPANSSSQPTLLITGGSQGAHAINEAVAQAMPMLKQSLPELHVVHQTGQKDLEPIRAAYAHAGMDAEVSAFIDDMPAAFARAHVIVCRSGAATVAEVSAAGKVAIFIPFPQAADDHQRRNAEALSTKDAALLIPQKELTPPRLHGAIVSLFRDPARLVRMSANARALAHPDAAAEIAKLAYSIEKR
jgi:UDP-N-acetylglucosamine--N-acetylmuramyl-(pentapeptide) pyrophosphoryl-undecaprenol N-acetylglucosamine transferase